MTQPKPGYKTTEFWLTASATLVGLAYASGIIAEDGEGTWNRVAAFLVAAFGAAGYSISRGIAKRMPPAVPILFLAALLLTQTGCVAPDPGQDVVVIRAEQAAEVSNEIVDAFLYIERETRATVFPMTPEVKHAADRLRAQFPYALRSLMALTDAYKDNRTDENKANLLTAIATVQAMKDEARLWLTRTTNPALE